MSLHISHTFCLSDRWDSEERRRIFSSTDCSPDPARTWAPLRRANSHESEGQTLRSSDPLISLCALVDQSSDRRWEKRPLKIGVTEIDPFLGALAECFISQQVDLLLSIYFTLMRLFNRKYVTGWAIRWFWSIYRSCWDAQVSKLSSINC